MAPPAGESTTPLVKKQNAAREVVDVLHEISTLLVSSSSTSKPMGIVIGQQLKVKIALELTPGRTQDLIATN